MALNVLLFFQLHLVRKIYFDVNLNLVFSLFIILNNALLLGHILRTLFLSYCMFWFLPTTNVIDDCGCDFNDIVLEICDFWQLKCMFFFVAAV